MSKKLLQPKPNFKRKQNNWKPKVSNLVGVYDKYEERKKPKTAARKAESAHDAITYGHTIVDELNQDRSNPFTLKL